MRSSLVLIALTSACGFSGATGLTDGTDGPGSGGTDSGSNDGPVAVCVPGFLDLCGEAAPVGDLNVTGAPVELNTDTDSRCRGRTQVGGPGICVLMFNKVNIAGTVTVTGSRALALSARDTLIIGGTLDLSSRRIRPGKPGAGGGGAHCTFGTTLPGTAVGGGGGAAGATFALAGGTGGDGNQDSVGGGAETAGGTPGAPLSLPALLLGGCPGQKGGNGNGGPGGLAGGAAYLTAPNLSITGSVLATGGGGNGGGNESGGGGGGSGGMLVLQGDVVKLGPASLLLATGGGGGQGGDNNSNGEVGEDPTTTTPADGGNFGTAGGLGGKAVSTTELGNGGLDNSGGGGGGGSPGFILVLSPAPTLSGAIAPTATVRAR